MLPSVGSFFDPSQPFVNWDKYFIGPDISGGGPSLTTFNLNALLSDIFKLPAAGGSTPGGSTGSTPDPTKVPDDATPDQKKWYEQLLKYGVPAALAIASIWGAAKSGSKEIEPKKVEPTYPEVQQSFGDWLKSYFTGEDGKVTIKGNTPYPGQLTPNIDNTLMNKVAGAWSPQGDLGMSWMAGALKNPASLGLGQYNPIYARMMQQGGMGGPGNQAMLNYLGGANGLSQYLGGRGPTWNGAQPMSLPALGSFGVGPAAQAPPTYAGMQPRNDAITAMMRTAGITVMPDGRVVGPINRPAGMAGGRTA